MSRIPYCWAISVATLGLFVWNLAGQGVVNTQRTPRPAPQAKVNIPVPKVQFEDVASAAGLKFQHVSGGAEKLYILEATGGGAAIFDYDNDGRPDIFLVNGSKFQFGPGEPR